MNYQKMVKILAVTVLWLGMSWPAGAGLTPEEKDSLTRLGLSENTLHSVVSLHQDLTRKRPPVLTVSEVEKLIQTGFTDEHVRLLATLDRLTGGQEQIPVTPAQVRELVASGVGLDTIRIMLVSEIARAVEQNRRGGGDQPEIGEKVVIDKEGRRHIIYFSGDTSGLGQEVITDSEGHRHIIYRSVDSKPTTLDERQQAELRRARELLDKIRINVHR